MTPFEYVLTLVSIILGLGITTLLSGIADWIKHAGQQRFFLPYAIWMLLVFILHIHEWWISYELRYMNHWRLPIFLFFILYPIGLYILAHLILPKSFHGFDARTFYLDHYPRFFITAMVLVAISMLHNVFMSHLPWKSQGLQALLLITLGGMVASRTRNVVLHHALAFLFLLMLVGSLAVTEEALTIQ